MDAPDPTLLNRREVLGMTQAEAGAMIAVHGSYVAKAEARADVPDRISRALLLAYDKAMQIRAAHPTWTPGEIAREVVRATTRGDVG